MNPEQFPSWRDLRTQACASLPADFSHRVLTNVTVIRRKRKEWLAASLTIALGLFGTVTTQSVIAYNQQQQNLTQWKELVAVAQTINQGL